MNSWQEDDLYGGQHSGCIGYSSVERSNSNPSKCHYIDRTKRRKTHREDGFGSVSRTTASQTLWEDRRESPNRQASLSTAAAYVEDLGEDTKRRSKGTDQSAEIY